eukprot:4659591-Pyramimonas_sp.AAC.1
MSVGSFRMAPQSLMCMWAMCTDPDAEVSSIFEEWYRRKRAHSPPAATASTPDESPPKDTANSSVYLRPPDDGTSGGYGSIAT